MRLITLLWHGDRPIGICVFTVPPSSLSLRNKYFGFSGKRSRIQMQVLNRQLSMLSRVVIHPAYRGAGITSAFIRASCRHCPSPWIETLTAMGHIHPFFEKAGFHRVGTVRTKDSSLASHSALYSTRRKSNGQPRLLTPATFKKSRFTEPVYYIFDNRSHH